jgi:hypothetical protein
MFIVYASRQSGKSTFGRGYCSNNPNSKIGVMTINQENFDRHYKKFTNVMRIKSDEIHLYNLDVLLVDEGAYIDSLRYNDIIYSSIPRKYLFSTPKNIETEYHRLFTSTEFNYIRMTYTAPSQRMRNILSPDEYKVEYLCDLS